MARSTEEPPPRSVTRGSPPVAAPEVPGAALATPIACRTRVELVSASPSIRRSISIVCVSEIASECSTDRSCWPNSPEEHGIDIGRSAFRQRPFIGIRIGSRDELVEHALDACQEGVLELIADVGDACVGRLRRDGRKGIDDRDLGRDALVGGKREGDEADAIRRVRGPRFLTTERTISPSRPGSSRIEVARSAIVRKPASVASIWDVTAVAQRRASARSAPRCEDPTRARVGPRSPNRRDVRPIDAPPRPRARPRGWTKVGYSLRSPMISRIACRSRGGRCSPGRGAMLMQVADRRRAPRADAITDAQRRR